VTDRQTANLYTSLAAGARIRDDDRQNERNVIGYQSRIAPFIGANV